MAHQAGLWWQESGKSYFATGMTIAGGVGTAVAASAVPGAGEAMDLYTLADPNSAWWDKGLSVLSLGASFACPILPNYGALRGGVKAADGVEGLVHASKNTRFIDGVKVVDRRTGNALDGTVDLKPTLDRIAQGKSFPHRNDGSIFQNRPLRGQTTPQLPAKHQGYYTKYVHPTPGVSGPGPQRVVTGQEGEIYYTPDHYTTFIRVNP